MAKTAYISSTYADLKEHRQAVYGALRKIGYDVVAMEDYVATDERTVDKCLAHASGCDVYIGLFGWRYGYIPEGKDNCCGSSITELEYRAAREARDRTTVRTFLLDEDEPQTPAEPAASFEKLKALRRELAARSHGRFRTIGELVEQVLASIYTAEAQVRVEPQLNDIRNANLIPLEHSGLSWIAGRIQEAIERFGATACLTVDLGAGESWWSTRLYLATALLEEYTSIRDVVFFGAESQHAMNSRYLGICSTNDVRRALAVHFRTVDQAYRESVPERVFDPVAEVPRIVSTFAGKMHALAPGGEREVMRWVTPYLVKQWRGFRPDRIELTGRKVDGALLDEIVSLRVPYVALVRDGQLESLVDRSELATILALRRH